MTTEELLEEVLESPFVHTIRIRFVDGIYVAGAWNAEDDVVCRAPHPELKEAIKRMHRRLPQ